MSVCLACVEPLEAGGAGEHHASCLERLFGGPSLPAIDVEVAKLHTAALAMVGRVSISGVQRKISLGLSADRATLQVAVDPARYILKPDAQAFPALPQNELVTMNLARLVGITVPPCALVRLKDGSFAYLIARFDRFPDGRKLRQEDFCQLAERSPKDKYDGSAELCARLVRRFTSEPGVEIARLYRLVVFAWWTGNGDMHLKNFSLLAGSDGRHRLSPGYDLLCTRLAIPDDQLALAVSGKRDKLTRNDLAAYAEYCRLPRRAAERTLGEIADRCDDAVALVERSSLDGEMKGAYAELLRERTRSLKEPTRPAP